jgi:glycosyltransferase involved in cell wall biosynthesis
MKILIISNMYPSVQKPYSGIFVLNQFNYLKNELNQNVELYAMKRTFTSKIGSLVKYFKAFIGFFPYYFKKYDVIHVHFFYPLIILAVIYKFFHRKTKLVVTFHGTDISSFMNSNFSKFFFKKIINKCEVVISVGQDLSDLIYSKLGRKSDYIISAGVDNKVFYKLENIEKSFDFIFVGSFIKRKGVDLFIEAIKKINNKEIKYCFVGSGEFNEKLIQLNTEFNVTVLHNKTQNELRELYNKSKFFVIPSRDEPFGLVATEAMFCGTPAIVSEAGGLKAQVQNGENGYVVKIDSIDDLVSKLKLAYNINDENYFLLSQNALVSNKEHSLESICNKIYSIYKQ